VNGTMKTEAQKKEVLSHPFHYLLVWGSFVIGHSAFIIRRELDIFLRTIYSSPP
jgi:hypothetical protein